MLRPKKTIPSLTVAMLALTGCGGDGNGGDGGNGGTGGTGGNGGDGLEASLQAFCMNGVECTNGGTTVDACIDYYNSLIAEYNVTPTCEAALISYFDCAAALSCSEFVMDPNSCTDEYYAIFDDCLPL